MIDWQWKLYYSRMKFVEEGSRFPKGYGLAYWEHGMDRALCFPIPFNLVVRLWHRLELWYCETFKQARFISDPMQAAYRKGKYDGALEASASKIVNDLSGDIKRWIDEDANQMDDP